MAKKKSKKSPICSELVIPVYHALLELGGSGTNSEIYDRVVNDMNLTNEQIDESHSGNENITELEYQMAWARTYLKNYGVIENSKRSVWSILPKYASGSELQAKEIMSVHSRWEKKRNNSTGEKNGEAEENLADEDDNELPEEVKPWRKRLSEILQNMDPYAFERLAQRVLRECGFTQVTVTKKSGDGGIDGTGKLRINGIFSFNVAFQCKRYKGLVGAPEIRDFRGSLTTDIEKGVMITTGSFSRAAKEEACNPGKRQIDLIDGEEFINKIAEYNIGVKEVTTYEIDEEYFNNI